MAGQPVKIVDQRAGLAARSCVKSGKAAWVVKFVTDPPDCRDNAAKLCKSGFSVAAALRRSK